MKKLTSYKPEGYGGCMIWIILVMTVALLSCNRKLHTEKTETHEVEDKSSTVDSLNRIIKTWANAYEELLKTTNSTGVVFESIPCDSSLIPCDSTYRWANRISGPSNKITISPDGTKIFEGRIKSYRDDATKLESKIFSMQGTIDSLNQLVKKDTTHHEQSAVVVVRRVKTSFTPLAIWVLLIAGWLMWANERFKFITIPFLNRKK